jgi:homoserine dehydrogenase
VVADVVDIAVGNAGRTFEKFRMLNDVTQPPAYAPMEALRMCFYIRLSVADRPGALAQIAKVFGDHGISLRVVEQHDQPAGGQNGGVPVIILTDVAQEGNMRNAIDELHGLDCIKSRPVMIRVVEEHEEYPS